jgi:hypothetical protein
LHASSSAVDCTTTDVNHTLQMHTFQFMTKLIIECYEYQRRDHTTQAVIHSHNSAPEKE